METISKVLSNDLDERAKASVQAICEAFIQLLFAKPYDDINVREIIERAGVARSTFYEHFRNKDDLHIRAMYILYEEFARNVFGTATLESNSCVLASLWERRSVFRALCASRHFARIVNGFDDFLVERLKDYDLNIPVKVISKQLAYAILMPVNGWLQGIYPATEKELSEALMSVPGLLLPHLANNPSSTA